MPYVSAYRPSWTPQDFPRREDHQAYLDEQKRIRRGCSSIGNMDKHEFAVRYGQDALDHYHQTGFAPWGRS